MAHRCGHQIYLVQRETVHIYSWPMGLAKQSKGGQSKVKQSQHLPISEFERAEAPSAVNSNAFERAEAPSAASSCVLNVQKQKVQ